MAIKKETSETRSTPRSSEPCWKIASRPRNALHIELRSGRSLLLPYMHWLHAELETVEQDEQLKISFTTHDVVLRGKNLKEILAELQGCNVELLREIPQRYHALANGKVLIASITVIEQGAESL